MSDLREMTLKPDPHQRELGRPGRKVTFRRDQVAAIAEAADGGSGIQLAGDVTPYFVTDSYEELARWWYGAFELSPENEEFRARTHARIALHIRWSNTIKED